MGNFFKKNDTPAEEQIFIEKEDVAALLKSERWGCSEVAQKAASVGEEHIAELLQELAQRPELQNKEVDIERLMYLSPDDIIDRFLRASHGRIVAEEGEPTDEIVVEADIDDDEDMVSEELAEVYLAQGLKDMAKETYRKLSLLNPEKSVYFAGLIEKIDKNN
jgi:bifunctional N-acetylglucosamine-1-phosphate-uridyltransferase/glucosamine-1-phosphate-acetyltransferase GlmU-like protein